MQYITEGAITPTARRCAAAIAVAAALILLTRLYLRMQQSEGLLDALSFMSQYFTILTNAMTFGMMLWLAIGRDLSPRLITSVSIAIVCVGLIYHSLLAHLVTLSGLDLWADHGTHTVVPLLAGLWWLFFAARTTLSWNDILHWITWPVVYCVYILIRANFSGFYPYPFLNVPEIGWNGLVMSVAMLLSGFITVGLIMTTLRRYLRPS